MTTTLKQLLSFSGLAVGVPSTQAHALNWSGTRVVPDIAMPTAPGVSITTTSQDVTVTRTSGGPADVLVLIESWHTVERAFGSASALRLDAATIVVAADGSGTTPLAPTIALPNGELTPLVAAQPITSVGGFARLADATFQARATVIGLVLVGAGPTLPVAILPVGPITLPIATWDAVTGQVGGLTPDATYYLDVVAGMYTTTPPTTSGLYLVEIGHGVTATTMSIIPTTPTLL